jgi:alkaline phosphatase
MQILRNLTDSLSSPQLGIENDTLVVVTADHGHGFDVYGSSDSKYAAAQVTDAARRNAVGTCKSIFLLPPPR